MDKDESFEILIEKVKQLSPENQKAIIFLIKNFDIVKKMCENSEMTDEEIQKKNSNSQGKARPHYAGITYCGSGI